MKIKYKIIASFLAVMVLFLLGGLIIAASVLQMNTLESSVSTNYAINSEAMKYQDGARQLQVGEFFVVDGNTAMGNQLINEGKQQMQSSQTNLKNLITDPSMISSLDEISSLEANVVTTSDEIDALSNTTNPSNSVLLNTKLSNLQDQVEALKLGLSNFDDKTNNNLAAAIDATKASGSFTIMMITIVFVIALILSILIALYLTNLITRPIVRLTEIANKVSNGQLNHEIKRESDDEIGDLSESFRKMINAFKVIQRMAGADTTEDLGE